MCYLVLNRNDLQIVCYCIFVISYSNQLTNLLYSLDVQRTAAEEGTICLIWFENNSHRAAPFLPLVVQSAAYTAVFLRI